MAWSSSLSNLSWSIDTKCKVNCNVYYLDIEGLSVLPYEQKGVWLQQISLWKHVSHKNTSYRVSTKNMTPNGDQTL